MNNNGFSKGISTLLSGGGKVNGQTIQMNSYPMSHNILSTSYASMSTSFYGGASYGIPGPDDDVFKKMETPKEKSAEQLKRWLETNNDKT